MMFIDNMGIGGINLHGYKYHDDDAVEVNVNGRGYFIGAWFTVSDAYPETGRGTMYVYIDGELLTSLYVITPNQVGEYNYDGYIFGGLHPFYENLHVYVYPTRYCSRHHIYYYLKE